MSEALKQAKNTSLGYLACAVLFLIPFFLITKGFWSYYFFGLSVACIVIGGMWVGVHDVERKRLKKNEVN